MRDSLFADGELELTNDAQYRLIEKQVFNWGTFDGLHIIPISPEGQLILGASGSGKTTLLDAHATLLIPKKFLEYNAAARDVGESRRDRTLQSYIMGAWTTRKDAREVAPEYLRKEATWSAMTDRYRNGHGKEITLGVVMWMRDAAKEIQRQYFIFDGRMGVQHLEVMAERGFRKDVLVKEYPGIYVTDIFQEYMARFMSKFGMHSEQALRLLQKTLSSKNVSNLSEFVREGMLDEPATFVLADRFVSGYRDLDEAHRVMVNARVMIIKLRGIRGLVQVYEDTARKKLRMGRLAQNIESYGNRHLALRLERDIEALLEQVEACRDAENQSRRRREEREKEYEEINRQLATNDAAEQLESLAGKITALTQAIGVRTKHRQELEQICRALLLQAPTNQETFRTFRHVVHERTHENERLMQGASERRESLGARLAEVTRQVEAVGAELAIAESTSSSIPRELLDIRAMISEGTGIALADLPFGGELIDVAHEEESWRYAIERVLRPFALTLLVAREDKDRVLSFVHGHDLRGKIVIRSTEEHRYLGVETGDEIQMIGAKLIHKEGRYKHWVKEHIGIEYPFVCVGDDRELRNHERAVTITGLIRKGKNHYEKNDRELKRRDFAIGFDGKRRIEELKVERDRLKQANAELDAERRTLMGEENTIRQEHTFLIKAQEKQWEDYDVATLQVAKAEYERQKEELTRANNLLAELDRAKERCRVAIEDARKEEREAIGKGDTCQSRAKDLEDKWKHYAASAAECRLDPDEEVDLVLYAEQAHKVALSADKTAEYLQKAIKTVENGLASINERLQGEVKEAQGAVGAAMRDFKREHPVESADFYGHDIQDVPQYLSLLEELEHDGLPEAEQKFVRHMQQQAQINLMLLRTEMDDSLEGIKERLKTVNAVLARSVYDRHSGRPSHLELVTEMVQHEDVREFKALVAQALTEVANNDPRVAEEKYRVIQQIVQILTLEDGASKRRRETILDVRQHLNFLVIEHIEGSTEKRVHDGGGGKSGGQRQKLAATCLAAALRYQLGGPEMRPPLYGTIVMDEAFSKADGEFTGVILETFKNFGFQMVLSTPMKAIRACEPYVRGATYVYIQDHRHSFVKHIGYDEEKTALDLTEEQRHDVDDE